MIHYPHTKLVKDGWQGYCSCGFQGKVRTSIATAQTDADRHCIRESKGQA